MRWSLPLATVLCSLVLVSCGSSHATGSPSSTAPRSTAPTSTALGSVPTDNPSATAGLIQAQYPDCAQHGNDVAAYLNTGQPTGYDPSFGDQRQEVLSLGGQQRSLYIRQVADAVIGQCDQREATAIQQQQAEQQAAQQQAQQQAAAAAQQAAAAAQQAAADAALARAQPVCQAMGGQISWDASTLACRLHYIGSDGSTYSAEASMSTVTGQPAGPMDTAGTGANEQECATGYYPDLSSGPGYGTKGTWNAVLQACLAH